MDKTGIYNYLTEHTIAVLSTVDPNNKPYAATMFYVIDEMLNFYFFSRKDTRKVANIRHDAHVAVTVIDQVKAVTVQSQGIVEEIEDEEVRTQIVAKIAEQNVQKVSHLWPPPLSRLPEGELIIFKVTPLWLRYGDYSRADGADDGMFYEVLPAGKTTAE